MEWILSLLGGQKAKWLEKRAVGNCVDGFRLARSTIGLFTAQQATLRPASHYLFESDRVVRKTNAVKICTTGDSLTGCGIFDPRLHQEGCMNIMHVFGCMTGGVRLSGSCSLAVNSYGNQCVIFENAVME